MDDTSMKRYQRQTMVPELDLEGQQILKKSSVLLIGAGGLGSNSANILTRMGVGTLTIVDDDSVNLSNLHRTTIFTEEDIGKQKSIVLAQYLKKTNSQTNIITHQKQVTPENIHDLIKNIDLILDGTDTMSTRYLINEAAIQQNIPWVYAGLHATNAMIMGIIPQKTPCLNCISQTKPEKNDPIPVLGNLPVITAAIQCTEAIKILLGKQPAGLILYDIWSQKFETLLIQKNPTCTCCVQHSYHFL